MNQLEHECIVIPGGIYRHFKGSLYEVILATVGNSIDNTFYIFIFYNQKKLPKQ